MQKYFPIIIALIMVSMAGAAAVMQKRKVTGQRAKIVPENIGNIRAASQCSRFPQFLTGLKIPQPVVIDLSQKRFKGLALLYGNNFSQSLHPKEWEKYDHFSTYALDEKGNIFLAPTPFISIRENTFELQKHLYKLDTRTGKLAIFMTLEDVLPSAVNPYGINTLAYDCDDKTLWVAAIDETDYEQQRGVIYHIDPATQTILQKIAGIDALTLTLGRSEKGKFLLLGSAKENHLYAYPIVGKQLQDKPIKVLSLPSANERIRKIKITSKNKLALQAIPFSYSMIAQTTEKDRIHYAAKWRSYINQWVVEKK